MNTTDSFNWRDENDDHLLFGEEDDTEFFFDEGNREQYVEQLSKLTAIEELFVFVLGDTGIGKTALLREFARRNHHDTDCVYIEIPILVDTVALLDDIAKQCDIITPMDSDIDSYVSSIRNFIQQQHLRERRVVLIIDDADGLPDDSLRALLKLISKSGSPHFIFSGRETGLKSRITSLVPFYQTHTIEMAALTETEVASYIELYLAAYNIDNNFSDDDIYDMFLSSAGNMGDINKLISASVDAQVGADNADYLERVQKVSSPQIPRVHILIVVMAIIGLGALSIYFMNHTTSASKTQATSQPESTTSNANNSTSNNTNMETNAISTSEAVKPTSVAATATAVPTAEPTAAPKPSATPAPTKAPTTASNSSWLAKAPDSHFTLQMMSSYSKDSVTKLINQQSNTKEWAMYQTTHNGKPWFVAVYGNYASKDAAKAAAQKLPPGLKEGKPWPKAISDIHKEIKR